MDLSAFEKFGLAGLALFVLAYFVRLHFEYVRADRELDAERERREAEARARREAEERARDLRAQGEVARELYEEQQAEEQRREKERRRRSREPRPRLKTPSTDPVKYVLIDRSDASGEREIDP